MWTQFVLNPRAITSIFKSFTDLSEIELQEIILGREGDKVDLRFDVNAFPVDPPEPWKQQQFNTVQIILSMGPVENLHIENWRYPMKGKLKVQKLDSKIAFSFRSLHCSFDCQTDFLFVQKIMAYKNNEKI